MLSVINASPLHADEPFISLSGDSPLPQGIFPLFPMIHFSQHISIQQVFIGEQVCVSNALRVKGIEKKYKPSYHHTAFSFFGNQINDI